MNHSWKWLKSWIFWKIYVFIFIWSRFTSFSFDRDLCLLFHKEETHTYTPIYVFTQLLHTSKMWHTVNFKKSLTSWNSEFSFSLTSCNTYYLPIARRSIVGFIPFSNVKCKQSCSGFEFNLLSSFHTHTHTHTYIYIYIWLKNVNTLIAVPLWYNFKQSLYVHHPC